MSRFAMTNRVNRVVSDDGQNITFSGSCLFGGRDFTITTKLSDANRWLNGESIQECFPDLTAEEREILLSGIDNNHWTEMFGEIENDCL